MPLSPDHYRGPVAGFVAHDPDYLTSSPPPRRPYLIVYFLLAVAIAAAVGWRLHPDTVVIERPAVVSEWDRQRIEADAYAAAARILAEREEAVRKREAALTEAAP